MSVNVVTEFFNTVVAACCMCVRREKKTIDQCKSWAHSLPTPANGNPTWRKHVNIFHRFFIVALIHQMAMNCVPLQEEGVCEIATQLAYEDLKESHGKVKLDPTRWNGVRNSDGTTTGQYMSEIKCTEHWFRKFREEFPSVKRYKSSAMSIMRAKKATPAVRDAHYKGFQDFLDRLQQEGYLSCQQRGELWKYLCCYDETSFDPDGCSRKRYLSVSRRENHPKCHPKGKARGKTKRKTKRKTKKELRLVPHSHQPHT